MKSTKEKGHEPIKRLKKTVRTSSSDEDSSEESSQDFPKTIKEKELMPLPKCTFLTNKKGKRKIDLY